MLGQADRYLKQAIVDREPYVASAALASGMHLMRASSAGLDIVSKKKKKKKNLVVELIPFSSYANYITQ